MVGIGHNICTLVTHLQIRLTQASYRVSSKAVSSAVFEMPGAQVTREFSSSPNSSDAVRNSAQYKPRHLNAKTADSSAYGLTLIEI